MRRNSVPDPSWKSGPPEPKHSHSSHDIDVIDQPDGHDFDGFGKQEAEQVDGEPLVVIQERWTCRRAGCDAYRTQRRLFTDEYLSDDEKQALDEAAGLDEPAAYVWDNVKRIDPDTIEVAIDSDMIGVGDSITTTAETTLVDGPVGQCTGKPHPPDPEPHGL